jgi:hypothetical protein
MAAPNKKIADADDTIAKLMDGHYDRLLAEFEAQLTEAASALRRTLEAMKAENTLRS